MTNSSTYSPTVELEYPNTIEAVCLFFSLALSFSYATLPKNTFLTSIIDPSHKCDQ